MKKCINFNKYLVKFALFAMPILLPLGSCIGHRKLKTQYVVTAKDADKIVYRIISCPYHLHDKDRDRIVTFYHDSKSDSAKISRYINVGDTINGNAFELAESECETHRFYQTHSSWSTIYTSNGKKIRVLQHRTYRDSIAHLMNKRHR